MAELSKLGRYELRSVLGKGAMGVVYEGFDPTLGRRVAVKTILKSVAFDDETERNYAERFVREAKAVARLNHANIVQVHDFGVENEVAYLVMEFIQGRELRSHFLAGERFETAECVRIMGELLDALDFAHEAGVIHRDVKPANVMLDAQRRAKLTDFGVARVQDSERSAAGTMVGTPAFMSPEQISGKKIDRRTDIFSAGTILYQLLTGEQPFKGDGAWTVAKQIMQDEPPRPSSITLSLTPAFDEVVNRALAKKPGDRFPSAKQFAVALREALSPKAQAAVTPERRQQPRSEVKATETELEFWRSIQNRDDLDELELYVEQFPSGAYTQLARLKIAKLKEPAQAARRVAEEAARKVSEEKEKTRQEAAALARRQAEEQAKRDAEEQARREALERTRREAAEKAKREAEAKAKRDAEEKIRQAQALARLRQQQEAAARAKPAVDEDVTVAVGGAPPAAAREERKNSYAIPAVVVTIVIAGGIGTYMYMARKQAREPVVEAPVAQKAAVPAPAAPPKAEVSAAEIEGIRKETEERIRREFADKSAAEQAKAAKAAADKAVQEKQLALKAAAGKAAAERVAVEKAARVAAETAAEERAAAKASEEKAAAARAAEERAAAAKAAAENAAAGRAAEEKAAVAKAAQENALAAKAPPRADLPGRYAFRLMTGSGISQYCDRNGFEEDIVIPVGGAQSVSGKNFSNLRFQSTTEDSIAATMLDGSNRHASTDVKLAGRATAAGYAGTYEFQVRVPIAICVGRWTLVRK